jgi:hypothetical protein
MLPFWATLELVNTLIYALNVLHWFALIIECSVTSKVWTSTDHKLLPALSFRCEVTAIAKIIKLNNSQEQSPF